MEQTIQDLGIEYETYTIKMSDKVYKRIRSEIFVSALSNPEGLSIKDEFLMKLFKSWDNNEIPEISFKTERDKEI